MISELQTSEQFLKDLAINPPSEPYTLWDLGHTPSSLWAQFTQL